MLHPNWRRIEDPYDGDVLSLSYEGADKLGGLGQSYESATLSPALFLQPGQSFSHRNRIIHIFGPPKLLDEISQKFLGMNWAALEAFDALSSTKAVQ